MSTNTPYRPDIDGLRAMAVLSVMAYHLRNQWLPGGFAGVDVFFVISGFVVTGSLVSSRETSFFSFIETFYARRLARILPALVAMLVVAALAATLFIPQAWLSGFSETTAKHAFLGLSNWVMQNNADAYFAPRAEFNPYTHTWSLGVEEQFYVLAPLLIYFWTWADRLQRPRAKQITLAAAALLTVASFVFCAQAMPAHPTVAFYFIGCRFWELSVGSLLFLATCGPRQSTRSPRTHKILAAMTAWAGLLCVLASFWLAKGNHFPYPWALLPVVGTALLIGSARTEPHDLVRKTFGQPALVWIGKRSYSLYLWHWPVYVVMRWTTGLETSLHFVAALAVTTGLSLLSYQFIEKPIRHHPWLERRAPWLRIAGFVCLAAVGFKMATTLFDNRNRISLSQVSRQAHDWYPGDRMSDPNVSKRSCEVDVSHHPFAGGTEFLYTAKACQMAPSARQMFVLGDSHAYHLAASYDQASAEKGINVSVYSFAGCAFIDFIRPMEMERMPGCPEFNRALVNHILEKAKEGDIVFLSSLRLDRYGDQWANFNIPDMHARMNSPERLQWRQAAVEDARTWLRPLIDRKLDVVFVAPTPVFKAPSFRCFDWFNHMNPICVGRNQQPRSDLQALREPVLSAMQAVRQTYPTVRIWDPFPLLCPTDTCQTSQDGRPFYFDGDHFSAYANVKLYPSFVRSVVDGL